MSLKQRTRKVGVAQERDFERANVAGKREHYLQTNPLERLASDRAYCQKLDYVRAALGPLNGRVLDIGGNTAGEATILQQEGWSFVVGDINEVALAVSRERAQKFGLKEPIYVGLDAHHLPFADASFSAVTVLEALHHLVDYEQALREIYRVLKPGGHLVSLEPNALDPLRRASEVRDRFRGTIEKSFYVRQLKTLCRKSGFRDPVVRTVAIGKSSWKLSEVPAYRRPLARVHGLLSQRVPRIFGSLFVTAHKEGHIPAESHDDSGFEALLRSPVNGCPLSKDGANEYWAETATDFAFPSVDGIPVLVTQDRFSLIAGQRRELAP